MLTIPVLCLYYAYLQPPNKMMQKGRTLTLLSLPTGQTSCSDLAAPFCLLTETSFKFRSNFALC